VSLPEHDILKTKPWQSDSYAMPAEIFAAKGMVGPEERRCYYWLANKWLSGKGCIVDAGAFVGASTLCFAAGAAAQDRRSFRGEPLIHAYDYFKVVDEYVGEAISRDFRPIAQGESYLDVFAAQTGAYMDLIRAYPGDFLGHRWAGTPIEILFIDIAKTSELCAHAVQEFFPSLIPQQSIIVHQDYFHCWHPYIHVGMEFLDDELELVDEHVPFQSRVWRLTKAIPVDKIERLARYDFTKSERLALLDRLIEKSSDLSRPMNEAVRAWQRYLDGDRERAAADIARMRDVYGIDRRRELWARQALEVEAVIAAGDEA
jgi:hypothetical protein